MSTSPIVEINSSQDAGQDSSLLGTKCSRWFFAVLVVLSIGIPIGLIHYYSWDFDYKDLVLYYGAIPFAAIPIYGIAKYIDDLRQELSTRLSRIEDTLSDILGETEDISAKVEAIEKSMISLNTKTSRITSILEGMEELINKISDIVEKIWGKLRQTFSFIWCLFWQSWLLVALVVIVIALLLVAIAILI